MNIFQGDLKIFLTVQSVTLKLCHQKLANLVRKTAHPIEIHFPDASQYLGDGILCWMLLSVETFLHHGHFSNLVNSLPFQILLLRQILLTQCIALDLVSFVQ